MNRLYSFADEPVLYFHLIRRCHKNTNHPFSLLELLSVILIIALLLALLLLPGLSKARQRARQIQCTGRLRQIGLGGFALYANDYGRFPYGQAPGGNYWHTKLAPYLAPRKSADELKNLGLLQCPGRIWQAIPDSAVQIGYARILNSNFPNIFNDPHKARNPSAGGLCAETADHEEIPYISRSDGDIRDKVGYRHSFQANVLFWDFHVEPLKRSDFPPHADRNEPYALDFWRPDRCLY